MEIAFECTYCGFKWTDQLYNERSANNQHCRHCKDKYPKWRKLEDAKVDYYAGSPPFPKKEEEKKSVEEELNYFRYIE